jgi:hypothetical protein
VEGVLPQTAETPTTSTETDAKTVVVSGDFTLDWNLARGRGLEAQRGVWEPEVGSRLRWQRGGAGLLADLIEGAAAQIRDRAAYEIRQPDTPRRTGTAADAQIGPEDPRFRHSYASWMPFPFAAKGSEKEKPAWRVAEFLGINRCSTAETAANWARVVNESSSAQLVVLDDADLGFRSKRELWPALGTLSRAVEKTDLCTSTPLTVIQEANCPDKSRSPWCQRGLERKFNSP